jgi:transposase-like protein
MLSERRDEEAATAFFKQAINNNGFPDKGYQLKTGQNSRPAAFPVSERSLLQQWLANNG